MSSHMDLWNRVEPTPEGHLKKFTRGGGFSGTAINPMQTIKRVTAEFGPAGQGWGYEVLRSEVVPGAPIYREMGEGKPPMLLGHESVYIVFVRVWAGCRDCFVDQVGQTTLVTYIVKQGRFMTDEEAPKKAITDGLMKALSHLGFGADVHLGLWDDSKYVNDRRAAEAAAAQAEERASAQGEAEMLLESLNIADKATVVVDLRDQITALAPHLVRLGMEEVLGHLRAAYGSAVNRVKTPLTGEKANA